MDLGTGVFLSAIFLGGVALYIATKDRWNWKKVILWPLGVVTALAVIGSSITYGYIKFEERPIKRTELWGISLKDTFADVKFKKGEPPMVLDSQMWAYKYNEDKDDFYIIRFKEGRVVGILYEGDMLRAPDINGIGHYDTLSDIEKALGSPSYVSKTKDELGRAYSFEKFNLVVKFTQGKISALGIYDPAYGSFKFLGESAKESKTKTYHLTEVPDTRTPIKK